MNALCQYARPGSIRELQSVIERAVTLASGPSLKIPVAELHSPLTPVCEEAKSTTRRPARSILAEVDRDQIVQALQETAGRVGRPEWRRCPPGTQTDYVDHTHGQARYQPQARSEPKVDTTDTSDTRYLECAGLATRLKFLRIKCLRRSAHPLRVWHPSCFKPMCAEIQTLFKEMNRNEN
jgi:transcriptional regulator with AAA-type ATPase domain